MNTIFTLLLYLLNRLKVRGKKYLATFKSCVAGVVRKVQIKKILHLNLSLVISDN